MQALKSGAVKYDEELPAVLSQIAHDRGFPKDQPFPRHEPCLLDNYQGLGSAPLGLL